MMTYIAYIDYTQNKILKNSKSYSSILIGK